MTRSRRDPRAERNAAATAGGRRPRFALGAQRGSARPRRDPRTDDALQQVAATPRRRLDRSQRAIRKAVVAPDVGPAATAPPAVVKVEAPAFLVAVVPDAPGGRLTRSDRQLFGAARLLAGSEGAVIAIVAEPRDNMGAAGADRIALVVSESQPAAYEPDGWAQAISELVATLPARHVLFPETPDGGDLARRVAVGLDEALFPGVDLFSADAAARAAQGRRVEQRCAPPRLMSLMPDVASTYSGAPREARCETSIAVRCGKDQAILSSEIIPPDPASVPLALADFVTAAGNGITDFDMFHRLVAKLGATPGASRVLCDAGRMPRAAQVGASGTVLSATCYVALGIAGAPQHLQGVADCAHVVAVNTDLHAAMIARAGLAIVQDAQLVMPALLAELTREAEGTR